MVTVTDLSTGRRYQVRRSAGRSGHALAMSLAMRAASLRMGRAIARAMAQTSYINRYDLRWTEAVPSTDKKMIGGAS